MKSILLTGCNRGIGLGLVKQLVKDKISPKSILVTCRDLEKGTELREIADQNKNVHILQLDVQKTETFENFAKEVENLVADDGLNVLVNNAGYSPKSTRINFLKAEDMMETFAINTVGPLLLTKSLLPLLKKAADSNPTLPLGINRSAVVNISTIFGSISLNDNGGLYPYRCSKAAINMATKSLSIDLKDDGIIVTSVHPGWVKTRMGGARAQLEVDDSAGAILNLIKDLSEKHNGQFYSWEGKQLEW